MVKKSYKELRSKMSLVAQKKSEAKAKAMIRDMALNDLRQAKILKSRAFSPNFTN